MKFLGFVMSLLLAFTMTACGDDDGGGGSGGPSGTIGNGGSGDGYPQPTGPAPDLAALPGGTDPIRTEQGASFPDACSVLGEEMVLALAPDTGEGGRMNIPRSSTDQNGTAHLCQYAAETADGAATAFIGIGFNQLSGAVDAQVLQDSFDSSREALADDADFVDYGDSFGPGSSAYFYGGRLEVLVDSTGFSISAGGTEPSLEDVDLWRENIMVPIAENMVQRLEH